MAAKTHYIKYTKSSARSNNNRTYVLVATLERLNDYYGKTVKNINSLISQVNKDYDYQYACTYTRVWIEKVDGPQDGLAHKQL